MSYIPIITARKLIPILQRMGFVIVRQRGSHIHLLHGINKNIKITVPMHSRDLAKPTIVSILKQAGISIEEFILVVRK
ncbi:type II toxin-antitoxin system HicA family toxin [Candidatus Uhrbacteria bacterium]|nr:type II toxin-antitoxin system HicA family toxin [Candidatus Uhrbacteria bacterium]